MLNICYTGRLCLSPVILAQFTLEMCHSLKSRKIRQNPVLLGLKVINVGTPNGKHGSSDCDKQVCAYLQPRSR